MMHVYVIGVFDSVINYYTHCASNLCMREHIDISRVLNDVSISLKITIQLAKIIQAKTGIFAICCVMI